MIRVRRARVSEPKKDVADQVPGQPDGLLLQAIVTEMDPPQPPCSTYSFVFRAAEPTACDDAEALGYRCRRIDPLDCNASSILSGSEDGCGNRLGCAPCRQPCSALARRGGCPPRPNKSAPTRPSSAAESATERASHRLRPTARVAGLQQSRRSQGTAHCGSKKGFCEKNDLTNLRPLEISYIA